MRRQIALFHLLLFFALCFPIFFFVKVAHAAEEFSAAYEVTYDITPLGKTQVIQKIKLTNLTTNYYASEFSLILGKTKVENVSASDNLGALTTTFDFDGNNTVINVKFNQKIVGKGKSFSWQLSYSAPELVQKNGQIWEVDIPRLSSGDGISEYRVILSVPVSFGPLAFVAPQPIEKKESKVSGFSNEKNIYIFDKTQLMTSGISASFGEKQVFSFQLKYHLFNNNLRPFQTEIALPPDTNYQKLSYEELKPEPLDVRVDRDGNWLARYVLGGKQQLEVVAKGFVEVYPRPTLKVERQYQDNELASYTLPQPYWDVSSVVLKEKARELKTPSAIYNFVVSYLTYNKERLNQETVRRFGAQEAYLNPKDAVCMEFTDLFITLARAAGIPAREVNGYAYTQNERLKPTSLRFSGTDTLHAWPEYYDPNQGWIQVDPTWGNTSGGVDYFSKLDFNHITFVRKGLSSQQPLPAGAYKFEQNQKDDIRIDFAKTLPKEKKNIKIDFKLSQKSFAGFPIKGKVLISNLGNQALSSSPLVIESNGLTNLGETNYDLGVLPPFALRQIDINFKTKGFFQNEKAKISASLGDHSQEVQIDIKPLTILGILIVGGVLILVIFLLFTISIFIKSLRKKNSSPTLPN